jgi:hypothetical protein
MREYEAMIQAVSGKSIAEFTRRLLASKPSLAAFGDGTNALNYDALQQRYVDAGWGSRATNPMGVQGLPHGGGGANGDPARQQMVAGVFEKLAGLKRNMGMSSNSGSDNGGRSMSSSSSSSSSNSTSVSTGPVKSSTSGSATRPGGSSECQS